MRGWAGFVAAAALAGCATGSPAPAVPTPVRQEIERAVTVTVKGARTHSVTGRHPMVFLTRIGGDPKLSAVGLNPARAFADGAATVNVEVGMVGAYTGDGTYEVPAGTGSPVPTAGPTAAAPTGGTGAHYNVAVTVVTMQPTPRDQRFAYLLRPCSLTLRSSATEGGVDCPALVAANGDTISLTMTWGP